MEGFVYTLLAVAVLVGGGMVWRRRRTAPPAAPPDVPEAAGPLSPEALAEVIDPTAGQDRLQPRPRAPIQAASDCWIRPGRTVKVQGYTIERGMVYVGAGLYRDRRAWKPEDFLIDPTLRVTPLDPDHAGRTVPPWPAYCKLTPAARAAYLDWLAGGAEAPDVPTGYVLLYYYGLVYHLRQPEADADRQPVRDEVDRLRRLYGHRIPLQETSAG